MDDMAIVPFYFTKGFDEMKNINTYELRNCFVKSFDEFQHDVAVAISDDVQIEYARVYDEVCFITKNGDLKDTTLALEKLSKYYEVNIVSVHVEGVETQNVWVAYL